MSDASHVSWLAVDFASKMIKTEFQQKLVEWKNPLKYSDDLERHRIYLFKMTFGSCDSQRVGCFS